MAVQVPEVSAFLRSRHIRVVDEWTVECLDWLREEYQGQNVKPEEMKQYVYDQWLDSDLTEIATPALPQGIAQQQKTLLTGSYALQINSVQDVSIPAYGQLLKLQGKENENALVSATQPTQPTQNKFAERSCRMLMLQLTDGHQSLEGMEYQPVPHLNADTLPGTKILVHGTVQCRLGVLMLTANNVRVLGGDVESLMETNSKIQILSKALGLDGSQVSQQEPVQGAVNQQQPVLQDSTSFTTNASVHRSLVGNQDKKQETRSNEAAFADEDGFFSDDLGDDLDALMLNEIQQIEEMDQMQRLASSAEEETDWPADDDEIDEKWLEQVEQTHGGQVGNPQRQTAPTETKAPPQYPIAPSSHSQRNGHEVKVKMEQFATGRGSTDQSKSNKTGTGPREVQTFEMKGHTKIKHEDLKMTTHLPQHKGAGNCTQANIRDCQDTLKRVKEEPASSGNRNFSTTSEIARSSNQGSRTGVPPSCLEIAANFRGPDTMETHNRQVSGGTAQVSERSKSAFPETKPIEDMPQTSHFTGFTAVPGGSTTRSSIFQNSRTGSTKPAQATGIAARITKEPLPGELDSQITSSSSVPTTSTGETQSGRSGLNQMQSHSEETVSAAKRRRFHSTEGGGASGVVSSPVVSLSSVMGRIQAQEVFTFTIKGFIVTLISPLSRKDGCWGISAKISDKTASLDVDLSNEVLTGLIGFSVPEMMQMKKTLKTADAKTAKELETRMRQGLAQCQQSLIDMHCTMTIQVSVEQQRPLVTLAGSTDPDDLATNFRQVPNKP